MYKKYANVMKVLGIDTIPEDSFSFCTAADCLRHQYRLNLLALSCHKPQRSALLMLYARSCFGEGGAVR